MVCVAGSLKTGGALARQQCCNFAAYLFLTCMLLRSPKLGNSPVGRKILFTNMNVDEKKLPVSTYLGERYFTF